MTAIRPTVLVCLSCILILLLALTAMGQFKEPYEPPGLILEWGSSGSGNGQFDSQYDVAADALGNVYVVDLGNHHVQKFAPSLWFDLAGYESYLSVATLHETTSVRTLLQLQNIGAPRFAFKNTSSDIDWSFQH